MFSVELQPIGYSRGLTACFRLQKLVISGVCSAGREAITEREPGPVDGVTAMFIQIPGGASGIPDAVLKAVLDHLAIAGLPVFPHLHGSPGVSGQGIK